MNKSFLGILFFCIAAILSGCCFFAQCDGPGGGYSNYDETKSYYYFSIIDTSNRLLEITYAKSALVQKLNVKKALWYLSSVDSQETVYIKSTIGFDTLIYHLSVSQISIDDSKCCDPITTTYSDPQIIYCSNPAAHLQEKIFYIR